jgi:hypothetical protein
VAAVAGFAATTWTTGVVMTPCLYRAEGGCEEDSHLDSQLMLAPFVLLLKLHSLAH